MRFSRLGVLELDQWVHSRNISFLFPRRVVSAIAGLEEAKNLAGEILRPIQIRLRKDL
jgi:hypothetical protein